MKKLLAILLAALLVISAFAALAEDEKVTITWGVYETDNLTAATWQKMIDAFEAENPDIHVEPIFAAGERTGFWRTSYASGTFPDIITEAQKFSDIEGLYCPLPEDTRALFKESALVPCNGEYTLIPVDEQLRFQCYYHKDEFNALGLTEPTTWDDFIAVCKALKAAGKTPLICGGTGDTWATGLPWYVSIISPAILEAYPNFFEDIQTGAVKWNNDVQLQELTRWQDMVKAGYYYEGSMALDYAQAAAEFQKGTAVMMLDGSWAAAGFDAAGNDEIGVFPIPSPTGNKSYCSIIHYWAVSSMCKNPEAAWRFINYVFSNPDVISVYFEADGLNSVTREPVSYARGPLMTKFIENWADYATVLEIGETAGDYAIPSAMMSIVYKSLQNIFNGADVAGELDMWDSEYQILLDEA